MSGRTCIRFVGLAGVMHSRGIIVLCAVLSGAVGGCSTMGMSEQPRLVSEPPTDLALAKSITNFAKLVKWPGPPEASPVRQAHLLAPADWIVCAQSSARDLSPVYAMFFDGDKMVHYRIAVEVDDCRRVPFALVPEPPREEPAIRP